MRCVNTSGIFTGDVTADDACLFVTERHTFSDFVEGLTTPCTCGMSRSSWKIESTTQVDTVGYSSSILFNIPTERSCAASGVHVPHKRSWASSRVLAGHYLANPVLSCDMRYKGFPIS